MRSLFGTIFFTHWVLSEQGPLVLVQVTKAISQYYHINCLTVLAKEPAASQTFKMLTSHSYLTMVLETSFQNYVKLSLMDQERRRCGRLLMVIDARSLQMADELLLLSSKLDLGKQYTWLLFLNSSVGISSYLKDIYFPFDVNFIVATVWSDSRVTFIEPYQVTKLHPQRLPAAGLWTKESGLKIPHKPFFARRSDLEGHGFVVGSLENPPITELKKNPWTGKYIMTGFFADIWKELESRLNFSSNVVMSIDNGTGTLENGQWTGLVGMLVRNEIDIAISEFTPTELRSYYVDFSIPLLSTSLQIFFSQSGTKLEWLGIFRPFDSGVWLATLSVLFFASILLSYFYILCCNTNRERSVLISEFSLFNSFSMLFRSLANQGNSILPLSTSCRIIFASIYILSGVLIPCYSAALISYVTIQTPSFPFNSLETLLQDGTYRLHAARRTAEYSYFSDAQDPLLQEVFQKLMKSTPPENLPINTRQGLEFVCQNSKLAYFGPFLTGLVFAKQLQDESKCNIMAMENPLGKIDLAIAYTLNSPYRELINYQISRMFDDGNMRRIQGTSWPAGSKSLIQSKFTYIDIKQVAQIHVILVIGISLSLIVLLVERSLKFKSHRTFLKSYFYH